MDMQNDSNITFIYIKIIITPTTRGGARKKKLGGPN